MLPAASRTVPVVGKAGGELTTALSDTMAKPFACGVAIATLVDLALGDLHSGALPAASPCLFPDLARRLLDDDQAGGGEARDALGDERVALRVEALDARVEDGAALLARQHVPEAVAREEDAGPLAAAALLQRERARVRLARHGALRRRLEDEIP